MVSSRQMVSKRSFTGIITPCGWGPKGNVESISLQTTDENEFLIEKNLSERELRSHINASVRVKGKIRERIDGKKSLSVREFRLLDCCPGNSM